MSVKPPGFTVPKTDTSSSQVLVTHGTDTHYSKQGLGKQVPAFSPTVVPFQYDDYTIIKLLSATTGMCMLLARNNVTKKVCLFGCGNNDGKVITNSNEYAIPFLTKVDLSYLPNDSIHLAAVGSGCCAIQTDDFKVYIAATPKSHPKLEGENPYKEVNEVDSSSPFSASRPSQKLVDLVVGEKAVYLVTDNYELYVVGSSMFDTAKMTDSSKLVKRVKHSSFEKVYKVFARSDRVAVLNTDKGLLLTGHFSPDTDVVCRPILPSVQHHEVAFVLVSSYSLLVLLKNGSIIVHKDSLTPVTHMEVYQAEPSGQFWKLNNPESMDPSDKFVNIFSSSSTDYCFLTKRGLVYGHGSSGFNLYGKNEHYRNSTLKLVGLLSSTFPSKKVLDICMNTNGMNILMGYPITEGEIRFMENLHKKLQNAQLTDLAFVL